MGHLWRQMMKCALFMGLATLCIRLPARALEVADLTFYASFDDSLTATTAAGDTKPKKVTGQYEFVPGILGKAVVAGELGKELAYSVRDNLDTQKGSFSLWLKPLDWQAGDLKDHYLLSIPDKFAMRAAQNSGGVHLEWWNFGGATYLYPQGPYKDQWKHLVYTWGDKEVVLYQNGQVAGRIGLDNRIYFPAGTQELPRVTEGLLYLCDPMKTQDGGKNTTVVDELMIFNRPLNATEVRNLYRRVTAPLLEPTARIGAIRNPPTIDGLVKAAEWKETAEFCDFVDVPFGNLSARPVKANVAHDEKTLFVAVRDGVETPSSEGCIEIWLAPPSGGEPYRIVLSSEGALAAYRGSAPIGKNEASWQGKSGMDKGTRAFELAIPWEAIGVASPKVGDACRFNFVRRWSGKYGDAVSWTNGAALGAPDDPAKLGKLILRGDKPLFVMTGTGKLNYAQLDLVGKVIKLPGQAQPPKAEVRLQPADLKEFHDPKTLPGTKSYTGTQLNLDRSFIAKGNVAEFRVTQSFSDTDIDSLYLKVLDAAGDIIYQAQRPYVPQPPITLIVKTLPDNDRLEVFADVSNYGESPLADLHADIHLTVSGKFVKSDTIQKFQSVVEQRNLPLQPLPAGHIVVKGTLFAGKTIISEFTTAFDKLTPGPWYGNKLGKDDIVIAPFTPVKVEGQNVSMWGRTYRWDNSLFPVQITSAGEDLHAAPMELVTGGAATGKANAAQVKVVKESDARAVVECTGEVVGVPVVARHTIEYDGMCLTQLSLTPKQKTPMPPLSLVIPYKREHSTLYTITPTGGGSVGAVREKVNPLQPPMNGGRDFQFQNTVWLGNEDRGMTWFAEDGKGWRFKDNGAPLGIHTTDTVTALTIRFAATPFDIEKPLSLTFGLIASPVKPMRDNWRFMRVSRDWCYRWYGPFTAANNDIANPFPGYKQFLEERHKSFPIDVIYQMPIFMNTHQPECAYYGEEWMQPPRTIVGNDDNDQNFGVQRHLAVCLGSKWQDFMVYYAVKAFDDLHMDGYYFDGSIPLPCTNAAHGHGWTDDLGNRHPTWTILAQREFFKRLQVEFHKRNRPSFIFAHMSGFIEMPASSFFDMQWNGENFSTSATPARDYNKLITLSYFRAALLGQPFGVPQQWLVEFFNNPNQEPIGKKEIDTVLELALVHGVGDNCLASNLAATENADYIRSVLAIPDSFGVREKDCKFLPYWNNSQFVTIEPSDENLVCSLWQRPGKVLLILANATQTDQYVTVRLNALGLRGNLTAKDMRTDKPVAVEAGVIRTSVAKSNWGIVQVEAH